MLRSKFLRKTIVPCSFLSRPTRSLPILLDTFFENPFRVESTQHGPMIPSLSPSNFLESRFPFLRATYTRAYTDTLVHTRVVTVTVSASEEEAHYAQSISAPRHLSRSRNRDENARGPRVTHISSPPSS